MIRKFALFFLIFAHCNVYGQTDYDFIKFVNGFSQVDFPYVASEDVMRGTRVNASARSIDTNLYEKFVTNQGIRPVPLGCYLEDFVSYASYIQFPHTDSVYLLVLIPRMIEPQCGGGNLLVSYSRYTNQLQDTLWVSYAGGFEISRTSDQQIICSVDIESVLAGDTIFLERKHTYVVRIGDLSSRYRSIRVKIAEYQYKYLMTVGGQFKQISVNRKEEILDEELVKILEEYQ